MIKILVVDDHDLMRMGLVRILNDVDGFSVIAEAGSGEEAVKLARKTSLDVVLMDVKMPGIGGLEATRRLIAVNEKLKIIAVTSCRGELFPSRLLQAGAMAYLTKTARPEEVIKAINMVMVGKSYVSQEIAQQLALKNTGLAGGAELIFSKLSSRELEVAMMTIKGERPAAIANILNVSAKTVGTYRLRIFDKLGVGNDVELVHLAIKHEIFDVDTSE